MNFQGLGIYLTDKGKMKLFVACSKHFYDRIPQIKSELEGLGHEVSLPNSYDEPLREEEMKGKGLEAHAEWKAEMLRRDRQNIEPNDAILVLNFEKNRQPNYIGGATFLKIYKTWELRKGVFLYHPIPHNIFKDELIGMKPVILNEDLRRIK